MKTTWLLLWIAQTAAPSLPSVVELRATARQLLEGLCDTRCDVVELTIKKKPAAALTVPAPGFEPSAPREVPGALELNVLFDQKLPPEYRRFVRERLRQRMSEFGLPVSVVEQVLPFPERPPLEAPLAPNTAAPPAPVIIEREAAPAAPEPPPLRDRLLLHAAELLPVLLLGLLLVFTVLRLVGRFESLLFSAPAEEPAPEPKAAEAPRIKSEPLLIQRQLVAERGRSRRIFQRLLAQGEYELVERAVRCLGPEPLRDLAYDPAVAPALARVAERTRANGEPNESDNEEVLRRLSAELKADRLLHPEDEAEGVRALYALSPEAFAALVEAEPKAHRLALLRQAPASLSESFLSGFAPDERRAWIEALVLGAAEAPPAIAPEALAAAQLRGQMRERQLRWFLELEGDEQERLQRELEAKEPHFFRRQAGRLLTETALLSWSSAALRAVWAELEPSALVAYLRHAPEAVRVRLLEVAPKDLGAAVASELALSVPSHAAAARSARRRILEVGYAAEQRAETAG